MNIERNKSCGDSPLSVHKLPSPFALNSATLGTTINSSAETVGTLQGYRSKFNIQTMKQNYYEHRQTLSDSRQSSHQQVDPSKFKRNEQTKQYSNNNRARNYSKNQQSTGAEPSISCDVCERYFRTADQLDEHIAAHDKCCFEGCNFAAMTSIVQNHIETQHNSDFFQKIPRVETEEDIEKWRAERRKRYPSKQNMELRQMEQEARLQRGERLSEPNKRFNRPTERRDTQRVRPVLKKRPRKRTRGVKSMTAKSEPNTEPDTEASKVQAFRGISPVKASIETETIAAKPAPSSTALTALAMYSSDSDDDEDEIMEENNAELITLTKDTSESITITSSSPQDIKDPPPKDNQVVAINSSAIPKESVSNSKSDSTSTPTPIPITADDSDGEGPDEQPIQYKSKETANVMDNQSPSTSTHNPSTQSKDDSEAPLAKKRRGITLAELSKKYRPQNSLLEKLLQKDIRHERNVLLQCVRYVVANNFFDSESIDRVDPNEPVD